MKQYTDEQVLEEYKNLPGDLKKAIFSVEMTEAIKRIGEKYQLAIDKIGALGNETGMVMLGVTHPRDFISNLSQRLGVSSDVSRQIADEINQQIFSKVRESLKKIHGVGETSPQPSPLKGEGAEPAKLADKLREAGEVNKEEIIKEIEKEEPASSADKIPEILKGVVKPELLEPPHPFEVKTKEEIFRMPAQESEHKYPQGDPYREPTE